MTQLGKLSDAATPVVSVLGDNAPAINAVIRETGPFAEAARPAVRSLGKAAVIGKPAVIATKPLLVQLNALGHAAPARGQAGLADARLVQAAAAASSTS